MENKSFNMFWIFKFLTLRNGKVHDKKFKTFLNKHLKFLSRQFAENGKEKLFPNDSSFLKNLKNAKQILSWQSKFNKFLQTYLIARSTVSHFSTKEESVIILKITNFWRKNMEIFHDVKTIEIFFPYNRFVSYICWRGIFFSRLYRDWIKNIFHNIWRIFRRAKIKRSNSNF